MSCSLPVRCIAAGFFCLLVAACAGRLVSGRTPQVASRPAAPLSRLGGAPARIESSRTPDPPVPTGEEKRVTLTVVYDNYGGDERLQTAWGFACLVTSGSSTVLFDTGGDGSILLANLAALGVNPHDIDAVVLSHIHADHTGGLAALLEAGARPAVYAPAAFPASFKDEVRKLTKLIGVTDSREILPGIHSSGELGTDVIEQALVVESGHGLIVLTGCAHPGVAEMVRHCQASFGGPIAWVIGGFHLGDASESRIHTIIEELRQLGVQRVAPCHCTGDQARKMFERELGAACFLAGVGWRMSS